MYCSSLKRTRQTAEIISEELGKKPKIAKDLKEMSFGLWEGKTASELIKEKDMKFLQWAKGFKVIPPKGESFTHFQERIHCSWQRQSTVQKNLFSQNRQDNRFSLGSNNSVNKLLFFKGLFSTFKACSVFRFREKILCVFNQQFFSSSFNYC